MPQTKKRKPRKFKAGKNKGLMPFRRHRSMKQHLFQIAVILIALWFYKQYDEPSVCKDPLDALCPDKYFSDNYTNARHKFLSLSATITNANTFNLPVYPLSDGSYLYTDVTVINGDSVSDHVIIHISGTHGVEGFSGSAIQCALLEYISNSTHNEPVSALFANYSFHKTPANNAPIIIFIHALNPYGFHFGRRVNEHNVDLNRNFKTKSQWQQLMNTDYSDYNSLSDFFNPRYDLKYVAEITNKLPSSKFMRAVWMMWYYWSFLVHGAYHLFTVGKDKIAATLVTGQWFDDKGLQYNGEPFKLEASHRLLYEFIDKMFATQHPEWKTQLKKMSFVDVHTGLGAYAVDTLIVANANDAEALKQLMPKHADRGLVVDINGFMDGGYRNANGGNDEYVNRMMNEIFDGKEINHLGVSQEFGTYAKMKVFAGLRLENAVTNGYNQYVQMNGDQDMDEIKDILNITRKRLRDLFYVQSVDWKKEIITRGFDLFRRIYDR